MSHADIWGEVFQAEGKLIKKALRQECAWRVKEEQGGQSGQGRGSKKGMRREQRRNGVRQVGSCRQSLRFDFYSE